MKLLNLCFDVFSLFSNKREISVKELKITYFWNILLKWDSTLNLEIKLEY